MKTIFLITLVFLLEAFRAEATGKVCAEGQYFVSGHSRNGYVRADRTIVKATTVRDYCKNITKESLYFQKRFKSGLPPAWPHKAEQMGVWKESDKERIVEVLGEIPEILLSENISGIYRLKKSKDFPNPASSAEGITVIYDTSFSSNRDLGRILAHEFSHQKFFELTDAEKQDYRRASDWRIKVTANRKIYWVGRTGGYVEEDGRNSLGEDFANNIEYYLYDSDKLKKVTPKVYEWIKKYFGDNFQVRRQKK